MVTPLRRGIRLEYATLGWNVVGVPVLAIAALLSGSVAAASFGLDSAVEIGASILVIRQLTGASSHTDDQAVRWLGLAFLAIAAYVVLQAAWVVLTRTRPDPSPLAIAWNAATLAVMLALAWGKGRIGRQIDNRVLLTESRVTLVDAYLAGAILAGLVANAALGWWWADPAAGLVIVAYALREARQALRAS